MPDIAVSSSSAEGGAAGGAPKERGSIGVGIVAVDEVVGNRIDGNGVREQRGDEHVLLVIPYEVGGLCISRGNDSGVQVLLAAGAGLA